MSDDQRKLDIEQLIRIESAARIYFERYCQDEAEDADDCLTLQQHEDAKALRDALGIECLVVFMETPK